MNMVLKVFLSMSVSGSLLTLTLFAAKQFLKDKVSRQWQYYIWLIVVIRLLLPFGAEINLMGKAYQAIDQAREQAAPSMPSQNVAGISDDVHAPSAELEPGNQKTDTPLETVAVEHPFQDIVSLLFNHIWLIWLAVALGLMIQKITVYQSFIRYINSGLTPFADIEILDRLSIIAEQIGVKRPIELCVNPLVSSPLLIGFFHPCIILPSANISESDFRYIVLHELTHYKRRDMFYKWLVQGTVCLHWFNPLVYLMSREITKACEFSCDEAVLSKTGYSDAQGYGKTLLDAMVAVGKYQESLGAVTLSENKQLLKERLAAIMISKRRSKATWILTGVLTLCMVLGASFLGVYPIAAAADTTPTTSSKAEAPIPSTLTPDNISETSPQYVKVDFSGVSITGQGPVGVVLVRTSEADVTFEYLRAYP